MHSLKGAVEFNDLGGDTLKNGYKKALQTGYGK
jgi:hypothetical protein